MKAINKSIPAKLIPALLIATASLALTSGSIRAQENATQPTQTGQPMQEPTPENLPRSEEAALPPAQTAYPAAVPVGVRDKFAVLDANHDGSIDNTEAAISPVLASQFSTLDSSGDGKLSIAEFAVASNLAAIRVDADQRKK